MPACLVSSACRQDAACRAPAGAGQLSRAAAPQLCPACWASVPWAAQNRQCSRHTVTRRLPPQSRGRAQWGCWQRPAQVQAIPGAHPRPWAPPGGRAGAWAAVERSSAWRSPAAPACTQCVGAHGAAAWSGLPGPMLHVAHMRAAGGTRTGACPGNPAHGVTAERMHAHTSGWCWGGGWGGCWGAAGADEDGCCGYGACATGALAHQALALCMCRPTTRQSAARCTMVQQTGSDPQQRHREAPCRGAGAAGRARAAGAHRAVVRQGLRGRGGRGLLGSGRRRRGGLGQGRLGWGRSRPARQGRCGQPVELHATGCQGRGLGSSAACSRGLARLGAAASLASRCAAPSDAHSC